MRRAEPTLAPATYVTQLLCMLRRLETAPPLGTSLVFQRKNTQKGPFYELQQIIMAMLPVLAASFAHQIAPLCDSSSSAPRECGTRNDRGFVLSRLCLLT